MCRLRFAPAATPSLRYGVSPRGIPMEFRAETRPQGDSPQRSEGEH